MKIISDILSEINKNISLPPVVCSVTTPIPIPKNSDLLTNLLNDRIRENMESFYNQIDKPQREVFKYLNYFFNKFKGNIQIPIKNICDRFNVKPRWVHKLLKRLKDNGLLITTKRGYGRKVTRRTFTARGLDLIKGITQGFGNVKQDTHRNSTDYRADYSGGHSNYISSKEDILQTNALLEGRKKAEEIAKPPPDGWISAMKALITGNK